MVSKIGAGSRPNTTVYYRGLNVRDEHDVVCRVGRATSARAGVSEGEAAIYACETSSSLSQREGHALQTLRRKPTFA